VPNGPTDGLRFGIAAACPDIASYVEWARLAESSGYDLLGYGDSQCLIPEMSVALAAMATVTTRARLCPTVSNPITRHPSVMFSAFGALQQLSAGRTCFCIGTGDSAALSIGARPATLAALAEYAAAFRSLSNGEEATYLGQRFRVEWDAPSVPLWIAGGGPRTLRLAGAIADGVLLGAGLSEAVVRDSIEQVRGAAIAAGRDPAGVEIWIFSKIYVCDDEEEAWRDLAWTLAASAHHAFRATLDGKFVPDRWRAPLARLQRDYVVREHDNLANAGSRNAELVVESGLTEFLGPRFLLAGPPARIVARIRELDSWGVTGFFTSAMFGDPFAYTRAVAEQVIAPLRRA
jgi:alkanesulfonate monooxygenase SsuD/methylene tetrahydromethanopterin reductase-like flavin-dependent oxidoreductase (luciferase family)